MGSIQGKGITTVGTTSAASPLFDDYKPGKSISSKGWNGRKVGAILDRIKPKSKSRTKRLTNEHKKLLKNRLTQAVKDTFRQQGSLPSRLDDTDFDVLRPSHDPEAAEQELLKAATDAIKNLEKQRAELANDLEKFKHNDTSAQHSRRARMVKYADNTINLISESAFATLSQEMITDLMIASAKTVTKPSSLVVIKRFFETGDGSMLITRAQKEAIYKEIDKQTLPCCKQILRELKQLTPDSDATPEQIREAYEDQITQCHNQVASLRYLSPDLFKKNPSHGKSFQRLSNSAIEQYTKSLHDEHDYSPEQIGQYMEKVESMLRSHVYPVLEITKNERASSFQTIENSLSAKERQQGENLRDLCIDGVEQLKGLCESMSTLRDADRELRRKLADPDEICDKISIQMARATKHECQEHVKARKAAVSKSMKAIAGHPVAKRSAYANPLLREVKDITKASKDEAVKALNDLRAFYDETPPPGRAYVMNKSGAEHTKRQLRKRIEPSLVTLRSKSGHHLRHRWGADCRKAFFLLNRIMERRRDLVEIDPQPLKLARNTLKNRIKSRVSSKHRKRVADAKERQALVKEIKELQHSATTLARGLEESSQHGREGAQLALQLRSACDDAMHLSDEALSSVLDDMQETYASLYPASPAPGDVKRTTFITDEQSPARSDKTSTSEQTIAPPSPPPPPPLPSQMKASPSSVPDAPQPPGDKIDDVGEDTKANSEPASVVAADSRADLLQELRNVTANRASKYSNPDQVEKLISQNKKGRKPGGKAPQPPAKGTATSSDPTSVVDSDQAPDFVQELQTKTANRTSEYTDSDQIEKPISQAKEDKKSPDRDPPMTSDDFITALNGALAKRRRKVEPLSEIVLDILTENRNHDFGSEDSWESNEPEKDTRDARAELSSAILDRRQDLSEDQIQSCVDQLMNLDSMSESTIENILSDLPPPES